MKLADGNLFLFDRILNGLSKRISSLAPRKLCDNELVFILFFDLRANLNLTKTVLIFRNVYRSAKLKIRKKLKRLILDTGNLSLKKLYEIMRKYRR